MMSFLRDRKISSDNQLPELLRVRRRPAYVGDNELFNLHHFQLYCSRLVSKQRSARHRHPTYNSSLRQADTVTPSRSAHVLGRGGAFVRFPSASPHPPRAS